MCELGPGSCCLSSQLEEREGGNTNARIAREQLTMAKQLQKFFSALEAGDQDG